MTDVPWSPPETDEAWRTAIEDHCGRFLGDCPNVFHELVSDLVHIDLYPYASAERDCITLVTGGVSDLPTSTPDDSSAYRHIELLCYLPASWNIAAWESGEGADVEQWWWPGRMLKEIGRFVHAEHQWLAPGHTVQLREPDEPLAPGSEITGAVLLSPAFEDDEFAEVRVNGTPCNFLWAFPLTARELEFKVSHGTEKLLDLLSDSGIEIAVDPLRASVA